MLRFKHEGYDVATASWTASAKPNHTIDVAYTWGADGIAAFSSSVGTRRVQFNLKFDDFMRLVAKGPLVDLQGHEI